MFTVEEHIHINKPPHEVHRFLLNPANYPKWIDDVKTVRATGPLSLGQIFEEVTVFQGEDKTSVGKVLEVQPGSRLVLQVTSVISGPKLLPTRIFTLRPSQLGTDLTWKSQVRVEGMMRLFQPFLPRMFHQKKARYLATLKTLLETPGQVGQ